MFYSYLSQATSEMNLVVSYGSWGREAVDFLFLEAIYIKRIIGKKIIQVLFKTESRRIKQKNGLGA